MLPSTGYFKGINCPFYESGLCERPYCHFRHSKKDISESNNESFDNGEILQQLVSEAVKKVLQHTDNNSSENDIGLHSQELISKVVQELAPVTANKSANSPAKVTYNPTPISELKKLVPGTEEFVPAPSRKEYLNRKHIPVPYTPHRPRTHGLRTTSRPEPAAIIQNVNTFNHGQTEKYTPVAMECETSLPSVEYLPGSVEHKPLPYSPMASDPSLETGSRSNAYTPTDISNISGVSNVALYTPSGQSISGVTYSPGGMVSANYSTSSYCPTNTSYSANNTGSKSPCYTSSLSYQPTPLKSINRQFSSDEEDEPHIKKARMVGGRASKGDIQGLDDLDSEFEMLGQILDDENDSVKKLQSNISTVSKSDYSEIKQEKSKPVIEEKNKSVAITKPDIPKVSSSHSKYKSSSSSKLKTESKPESSKKENKSDTSKSDKSEHTKSEKSENSKSNKNEHSKSDKSENSKINKTELSKSDQYDNSRSNKTEHSKNDKSEHSKSDKSEHSKSDKQSSKNHKTSRSSSNQESEKTSSVKREGEKERSKKENSSDRHHSTKKRDDGQTISKDKEKSKNHERTSSKSKSSESKNSNDDKSRKSSSSTVSKSKSHDSKSSSSDKKKNDKDHKSRSSSKLSSSETDKRSSKETSDKSRKKEHKSSKSSSRSKEKPNATIPMFPDDSISDGELIEDISDSDEENITQECLRIFEEYIPSAKEVPQNSSKYEAPKPEICLSKKRVAHNTSQTIYRTPTIALPDHKSQAVQLATDRYSKVKQFHESRMKRVSSDNFPVQIQSSREEPSVSTAGPSKVRIAHVPNVSTFLHAKKALQVPEPPKATVTQTVTKGTSRVAHMPSEKFCDRPGVLEPLASKIAVNIRSRYLNLMIDECLKIYLTPEDAYARAQQEELTTSKKCTAIPIYKNSAILGITRLRKEIQEANGVKINSGDVGQSSFSHNKLLLGKLNNTSWSIENKYKKDDFSIEFKGLRFYENISKWVLSEEELQNNGFPRPHPEKKEKGLAKIFTINTRQKPQKGDIRICCRCKKEYKVNKKGVAVLTEECIYHPNNKYRFRGEVKYQCCGQDMSSDGCLSASCHVYEYIDHDNLRGYVRTLPKDSKSEGHDYGVYALDCEMCYTTNGLDLTRVTVIDSSLNVVYESLVKPLNPIIDYNTRYSGLTEEHMRDVSTSLLEVQATFLHMFCDKTILVGHSLESDFKALKLIHNTVVDTSVLFPHKMGPPYKRALRNLTSEYLKKIIQNSLDGHDSAEDATVCMELLVWKLKEELKTR